MRYSEKAGDSKSTEILYQLAQEEKGHLKLLGKLMIKKIVNETAT